MINQKNKSSISIKALGSKKAAIGISLLLGGFVFWWYHQPFLWLGILLALSSGLFNYLLLNTRRVERYRRFFFIGIFVVVMASFLVIIEIWHPDFILNWSTAHLRWMEYYIQGESPGTLSFPCNRVVSQVFFGKIDYIQGLYTWKAAFPATLEALLLAMAPFLITGVIFGRGFCGWICPFGGLPELMTTGKKERWKLGFFTIEKRTRAGIRYTQIKEWARDTKFGLLLTLIILSVALSIPAVCIMCPALWMAFLPALWSVVGLVVIFAILLPIMNKRRWWCHICPIGAICSFLDKTSLFHIRIDTTKCSQCMKCVTTCRMFAISPELVSEGKPNSDCIRCGRCSESCPVQAIDINWTGTRFRAKNIFIPLAIIGVLAWYIWFIQIIADFLMRSF